MLTDLEAVELALYRVSDRAKWGDLAYKSAGQLLREVAYEVHKIEEESRNHQNREDLEWERTPSDGKEGMLRFQERLPKSEPSPE